MNKQILFFFLLVIVYCVIIYFIFTVPTHGTRVYNCSIAEISPDYPLDVKQECRKLNVPKNYFKDES
jgi:hypothetical protein